MMSELSDILTLAQQRADALHVPYAGVLTPSEAFELTQRSTEARIVDVRTQAERDWVGRIPQALEIEWVSYPEMRANPDFIVSLKQHARADMPLLFICRSGARSHQAALAAEAAGFKNCYNVLEGFEGDKDNKGHRGRVGGWKAAGLPWVQS
jgi:rhodanese-related sulfurtransferase